MKALRIPGKTIGVTFLLSIIILIAVILSIGIKSSASEVVVKEVDGYRYMYALQQKDDFPPFAQHTFDVQDIEGGFGELTRTFKAPGSYSVSANVKSSLIWDAIHSMIKNESISITEYDLNLSCEATMSLYGFSQQLSTATYTRDDYKNSVDFNTLMQSKTLSASEEYEVSAFLEIVLTESGASYTFRFNLAPMQMMPITDGSLINLHSIYTLFADTDNAANIDVYARPNGEIFSTKEDASCFVVESVNQFGLPDKNCSMTFVYDGVASVTDSVYECEGRGDRADPYTIQGILDFTDIYGSHYTLKTNVLTIRKHDFEMRIDGTEKRQVGINNKHEYTFIFDDNEYADYQRNEYYLLHKSANHTETTNLYFDNETLNTAYTFTETGINSLELTMRLKLNGGLETIYIQNKVFNIEVLPEEPTSILPDYNVTFSFPENAAAIIDGTEFEVSATINEVYGDERFSTRMWLTGASVGEILTTANSMRLVPLNLGISRLYFEATSVTAGTYTGSIAINVVQSTAENTCVAFRDEFNLTGSEVVAYLSIDGHTTFLNFTPTWNVQVESGETFVDTPFIMNEQGAAIIKEAPRGRYNFAVSGIGITSAESLRSVTNVNMGEIAQKYLPFVAGAMLLGLLFVMFVNYRIKRRRTLLLRLNKASKLLNGFIKEKAEVSSFRGRIKRTVRSLKKCLTIAEIRDQETLGQYSHVCKRINDALRICEAGRKSRKKLGKIQIRKFFRCLKTQYVDDSMKICAEIDEALAKFARSKSFAGVTLPKEGKNEKNKVDYRGMLTKFYRQGDIEDPNARSGDSDRDADTKSEN